MALTFEQKKVQVSELKEIINSSYSIIAWNYEGLGASESSQIKSIILNENGKDVVYKNKIFKIALKELKKEELNDYLVGKTSFLFTKDEKSNSLKELYKFLMKKNLNQDIFRGGYIEGKFYDSSLIMEIASLPSKDELISMLLSVMQGSIRSFAYLLSQIAEQKEK